MAELQYDRVPKFYVMDPNTEDVLFDGTHLRNGMEVLIADPTQRTDWHENDGPSENTYESWVLNRWCAVYHLTFEGNEVSFLGVYADGVKHKRSHAVRESWIVKKDSIPETEIEPATGLKITDLPNPNQLAFSYGEPNHERPDARKLFDYADVPAVQPLTSDAQETVDRIAADKIQKWPATELPPAKMRRVPCPDGNPSCEVMHWEDEGAPPKVTPFPQETDWTRANADYGDELNPVSKFGGHGPYDPRWGELTKGPNVGNACLNADHYDPELGHQDDLHEAELKKIRGVASVPQMGMTLPPMPTDAVDDMRRTRAQMQRRVNEITRDNNEQ